MSLHSMEVSAKFATGVVFRLDPDLSLHRMIENTIIPNGIGWSNDNKTLFLTDSPTKNLYAYDYDIETGNISNKSVPPC